MIEIFLKLTEMFYMWQAVHQHSFVYDLSQINACLLKHPSECSCFYRFLSFFYLRISFDCDIYQYFSSMNYLL